ncbi:MAG TPA: MnmC family methyltransferase [Burkholderiales bacterium]|nr:MnmC family methyltransferase [Burkholderiales bacterium]
MNELVEYLSGLQAGSLATPDGKPFLHEYRGELSLHFESQTVQSRMRRNAPDKLVLDYTRAMMAFLLFVPAPARIAMIGLGGGSMAKYCLRTLPLADFTAVEISPEVIAFRSEFAIPPDSERFRIVCGDGADYVSNASTPVDALIVDGFDANGQPPQLCSQDFYDQCYARLSENGVLVANFWAANVDYGACISRMRRSFHDRVVSVSSEDPENRIVFACKGPAFPPPEQDLLSRARELNAMHPINFEPMAAAILHRLRRRAGKKSAN